MSRSVLGRQLALRHRKSGKITSPHLYLLTDHKTQNTCMINCFNFQLNHACCVEIAAEKTSAALSKNHCTQLDYKVTIFSSGQACCPNITGTQTQNPGFAIHKSVCVCVYSTEVI